MYMKENIMNIYIATIALNLFLYIYDVFDKNNKKEEHI